MHTTKQGRNQWSPVFSKAFKCKTVQANTIKNAINIQQQLLENNERG